MYDAVAAKMVPVKNEKGVWYYVLTEECVYCGRSDEYRERRPAPAPPIQDRYEFKQRVCGTHFL